MSPPQPTVYPLDWWQDVPLEKRANWEISPASVHPPQVILSKRHELGLLSNFADTPFVFEELFFASLEGLWQSTKYPEGPQDPRWSMAQWPWSRQQVQAMVGREAKFAGSFASEVMKKKNLDWVSWRGQKLPYREMGRGSFYNLIVRATEAKYEQNPKVLLVLKRTCGLELLPDHDQGKNPPAAWLYHKIAEELRQKKRLCEEPFSHSSD